MTARNSAITEGSRDTSSHLVTCCTRHPFNGHFFEDNLAKPAQERLNFTEARDDGVAVASAAPYANYLHLAPDNHASTSSLNFYMPFALSDAQPTVSKH